VKSNGSPTKKTKTIGKKGEIGKEKLRSALKKAYENSPRAGTFSPNQSEQDE
jgi:hypothetical protein